MEITFTLTANNRKDKLSLQFTPDLTTKDEVHVKLLGKKIDVRFDPIDRHRLKQELKALAEAL